MAKTNLDHSVANGTCSAVPLSRESQCLALHLSLGKFIEEGRTDGRERGGGGAGSKKSWTIKYYTVFNTIFNPSRFLSPPVLIAAVLPATSGPL